MTAGLDHRVHAPPPALSEAIEAIWLTRAAATATRPATAWILPDGCEDLIVSGGASPPRTSGVTARCERATLAPGAALLGARFRPGWARHLFGRDVAAGVARLAADFGSPDDLGRFVTRVGDLVAAAPPPADALRTIASAIDAMRAASADVGVVARRVAIGQRALHRLFDGHVGIAPKRMAMIVRFRAAHAAVAAGRATIASVAADRGYADQSHLCREFRRLGGEAPRSVRVRRWI